MAGKLKIGVVGTGGIWNAVHAPAWAVHPEVEVVAACDIVEEKAQAYADKVGITRVFKDYRDLLKLDELDIVEICTPNLYHSEIAVAALNAGKHVSCEKPDAVSVAEARKMADAAAKSGKTLMVMRNNRFNENTQWMRRYIAAGHMGDIYTGRCGWIRRRGIPGRGGWFTTKALSGGGPLIDLGVHFTDVAVWLMGNPRPVSVMGATYCKFAESTAKADSAHAAFGEAKSGGTFDVEDLATGFIRFDNGATLHLEFSWASNVERESTFVELRGSKAGCSLKGGSELDLFTELDGEQIDIKPRLHRPRMGHHAAYLNHFIDVVQQRAEPIFKPADGVDMIKILTALYESARTGNEVKL